MKRINLWRVIWVGGTYAILGIILYLVIIYKVKWSSLDTNTYLYFYECNNKLCSTNSKVDSYYSRYKSNSDAYVVDYNGNTAIVVDDNKYLVYDYINGNVLSNEYDSYEYLSFNGNIYYLYGYNNTLGILNSGGEVILENYYDKIVSKNNYLIVSTNNMYGVLDSSLANYLDVEYQDIDINTNRIIIRKDNVYRMLSSTKEILGEEYNYMYIINDDRYLVVNKDNKIDVVDSNLASKLIMVIDGYVDYSNDSNINSLSIKEDGNMLYFNVIGTDNSIKTYKYDISADTYSVV